MPPLLNEVQLSKPDALPLPEMSAMAVSNVYESLKSYFDVFHPLMLYEMWENVSTDAKEDASTNVWWDVVVSVSEHDTYDDDFVFVRCETMIQGERSRPNLNDLVSVKRVSKDGSVTLECFGVVEKPIRSYLVDSEHVEVDSRLLRRTPDWPLGCSFVMRLRKNLLPLDRSCLYSVQKRISLGTFLRQIQVQSSLVKSPLQNIILKPNPDLFELSSNSESFGEPVRMNESQWDALTSISQTMVTVPRCEPRISLLLGPPGKLEWI